MIRLSFQLMIVNNLEVLRVSVREGASCVELNGKPFSSLAKL